MITYKIDSNKKGIAIVFYDHSGASRLFKGKHVLLTIPYSLIITDMFDKKALTPKTEMLTHTKGDIPAVLAVRIVEMFVNEGHPAVANDLDRKMKIPIDMLLKTVAYDHIKANSPVDVILHEMQAMTPPEETEWVLPAIQAAVDKINIFMNEVLIRMEFPLRLKLSAELLKAYHIVGNRASKETAVSFHPEVLS